MSDFKIILYNGDGKLIELPIKLNPESGEFNAYDLSSFDETRLFITAIKDAMHIENLVNTFATID